MQNGSTRLALRGAFLTCTANPFAVGDSQAFQYESDGLIVIEDGTIVASGSYNSTRQLLSDHTLHHYPDALIMPGFIDTHVHYPQTQMIGAYGAQLIEWLEQYTFPTEQQFADPAHATTVAKLFLDELLRAGTTTAAVYSTVSPVSANALFDAALQRDMRLITGKVLMDRNAPADLLDTAQTAYDDSLQLIERWHKKDRLAYAISPRFAPTSTPAQLEAAAALWRKHPDCYLQTHLSENTAEVQWVKRLFPEQPDYFAVYEHHQLVGPRAIFGHAIHLIEREWRAIEDSGSAIAHCPSSNLFLGSGLFDFRRALQTSNPIPMGLASDVGAGTTLSMLRTMGEAYKVGQLAGYALSGIKAFYLATLGAAKALHLEHLIGSIRPGNEADLLVLDLHSTPLIDFRMRHCQSIEETLFVQMIMADDRATQEVYLRGKPVLGSLHLTRQG